MIVANTFGSFALLGVLVLGGFILSRGSCKFNRIIRHNSLEVSQDISRSILPQVILIEETMTERNACKIGATELLSRGNRLLESGDEVQRSASSTSVTSRVGSISEFSHNRKHGMVLPFEPLSITFDDVRYAVDMPQVGKLVDILREVSNIRIIKK
ncbi:Pleiotropic drug resistance protein 1 [Camellia lanceoleosa]|uniref:Pleiotropic drug resistance protein 1 n=1 Tax=Camellia lanceoleosa TaxID=1840588 RepID=A0ACC0FGL2_9ERIC|nr:Pleiotropic drug resistance protein 1 [Camellia lanceoleosa]